jgi:hypothetical protein
MRGIREIIAGRARREAEAAMSRQEQEQAEAEAAGDIWLQEYNQFADDEDEAYARNAEMDRQAAEINAVTNGPGPGYDDVYMLNDTEADEREARQEGRQIVSEIDAYAVDPQYADVKDQIEDISGYVKQVMGLGDREPGQL